MPVHAAHQAEWSHLIGYAVPVLPVHAEHDMPLASCQADQPYYSLGWMCSVVRHEAPSQPVSRQHPKLTEPIGMVSA
jgi:hypothetical protein